MKPQARLPRKSARQTPAGSSPHTLPGKPASRQARSPGLAGFGAHDAVSCSQKPGAPWKPLPRDPRRRAATSARFQAARQEPGKLRQLLPPVTSDGNEPAARDLLGGERETAFSPRSLRFHRERGQNGDRTGTERGQNGDTLPQAARPRVSRSVNSAPSDGRAPGRPPALKY